jgi:hypothetical protein
MIREALEYIIGLSNNEVKQIGGQQFSTGHLHLIQEPTVKTLLVRSLSGLVEYLKEEFDQTDKVLIHVEDPTNVRVYSTNNQDMKRNEWLHASAIIPEFRYDSFYDSESFNIKLQSVFVKNDDRDTMLQVVGNLQEENVSSVGDDGVSQKATIRTGVATVSGVKVPNPVLVAPYRTFTEVEQPESNFIFRMQNGPKCALFEADGGAWKHEAMENISDYLASELQELTEAGKVSIIA